MELRTLGRSGLEVSVVGLGCNNFGGMIESVDFAASQAVIHAALDAGITLFDTADCYGAEGGSEVTLGKVLGARRKDIVLATKFAIPLGNEMPKKFRGSRRYVMQAVEDSLRRLNTDYIDLYQYHYPDPLTPLEETLRALEDLVRAGKVRYVGLSNHTGWQVVDATWLARQAGWSPVLSAQNEYSLLERSVEKELIPALRAMGMSLLPYFPLANGLLTGKYRKGVPLPAGRMNLPYFKDMLTDQRLDLVGRLDDYAKQHGHTLLELAFSWLLDERVVASVIAGATSPAQITANSKAAAWRLSDTERTEVRAILDGK